METPNIDDHAANSPNLCVVTVQTPLFKQDDLPRGHFDSNNELNQLSPTSLLIRRSIRSFNILWHPPPGGIWTLKDWFVKFPPLTQRVRSHLIVNCPSQRKIENVLFFGATVGFFASLYERNIHHTGCV